MSSFFFISFSFFLIWDEEKCKYYPFAPDQSFICFSMGINRALQIRSLIPRLDIVLHVYLLFVYVLKNPIEESTYSGMCVCMRTHARETIFTPKAIYCEEVHWLNFIHFLSTFQGSALSCRFCGARAISPYSCAGTTKVLESSNGEFHSLLQTYLKEAGEAQGSWTELHFWACSLGSIRQRTANCSQYGNGPITLLIIQPPGARQAVTVSFLMGCLKWRAPSNPS